MQSKTPASQLPDTAAMFEALGKDLSRSPIMDHYATRHAIKTAPNLTIRDDEIAHLTASYMHDRIAGKTVVEIGGGLGLLALHLGFSAQRVFCIEANPIWAATFTETLLQHKPKNVSYLFGSADEFIGHIRGNVAIFCSHSGISDLTRLARQFAPTVIDVWSEIISQNPEKFDQVARTLRSTS